MLHRCVEPQHRNKEIEIKSEDLSPVIPHCGQVIRKQAGLALGKGDCSHALGEGLLRMVMGSDEIGKHEGDTNTNKKPLTDHGTGPMFYHDLEFCL